MKTLVILFFVVVAARAQNLTINLPSGIITGCTVVTLTFTGGSALSPFGSVKIGMSPGLQTRFTTGLSLHFPKR